MDERHPKYQLTCECNSSLNQKIDLRDKAEEPVVESLRGSMVRLMSPHTTSVPSAKEAKAERQVSITESWSTFSRYSLSKVNVCDWSVLFTKRYYPLGQYGGL